MRAQGRAVDAKPTAEGNETTAPAAPAAAGSTSLLQLIFGAGELEKGARAAVLVITGLVASGALAPVSVACKPPLYGVFSLGRSATLDVQHAAFAVALHQRQSF